MTILAGIDIGGTKCAVSLGRVTGGEVEILEKVRFSTPTTPGETIEKFIRTLDELLEQLARGAKVAVSDSGLKDRGSEPQACDTKVLQDPDTKLQAIGISAGGPLNSKKGLILSPPNLPGWDEIDIVSPFKNHYQVPVSLQNDANAGALAEWKWGAGQGAENMLFLTFGTGMGAGLILNGALYAGTNDLAGEVGHIRLAEDGPVGYGKAGSFEGFCSGGGIARLAEKMVCEQIIAGNPPAFCRTWAELETITAQKVGEAAQAGDPLALEIFKIVGEKLGHGLAILMDILNPQKIVIGSIYGRQQNLLEPVVMEVLRREALRGALEQCQILPAGLGERIGDFASLSVAFDAIA